MYDKMIYIEKGVKYGPCLYREDFKYKETHLVARSLVLITSIVTRFLTEEFVLQTLLSM